MNVKDYEKIIRPRLKDARFEHSKNVSKEAVRLAKKYGADVRKSCYRRNFARYYKRNLRGRTA